MHVPFVREARNLLPRKPRPDHDDDDDDDLHTSVSIVYVTASKTFAGPAVWITQLPQAPSHHKTDPTPTPDPKVTPASPSKATSGAHGSDESSTRDASSARESSGSHTSLPASIMAPASTGTPLGVLTTDPNAPSPTLDPVAAGASSSANSGQNAEKSTSSSGMSAGGKAGLAIGILLAIGLIFGLAFFFYRRKKQMTESNHQRLDDEKGAAARNAAPMAAPRLSIRPVTQFLPSLGGADNRSRGNTVDSNAAPPANPMMTGGAVAAGAAAGARGLRQPGASAAPAPPASTSLWEKMGHRDHANDPNNPFGNHAEAQSPTPGTSPTAPGLSPPASNAAPIVQAVAAGAVAGAGLGAVAAATTQQNNGPSPDVSPVPKPLSIKSRRASIGSVGPPSPALPSPALPSPALTDVTTATGTEVPVALVAGARAAGPTNVHRVQMDFKPSMDDELEIHAGQLVRLLHAYDDGWALCVRMDRAQQGVVPRTCLSKSPVKPRAPMPPGSPRGPPPPRGSPPRGPPPNVPHGVVPRPLTPTGRNSPSPTAGPAPAGPPSGRNSPNAAGGPAPQLTNPPSPISPDGRQRSGSVPRSAGADSMVPDQRTRSNSVGDANGPRRNSPPGASPLSGGPTSPRSASAAGSMLPVPTRKPVPRQQTQ